MMVILDAVDCWLCPFLQCIVCRARWILFFSTVNGAATITLTAVGVLSVCCFAVVVVALLELFDRSSATMIAKAHYTAVCGIDSFPIRRLGMNERRGFAMNVLQQYVSHHGWVYNMHGRLIIYEPLLVVGLCSVGLGGLVPPTCKQSDPSLC